MELNEVKKQGSRLNLPDKIEARKQFITESVTSKSIRDTKDGLEIDFVISTSSVDRDQDTINVDGWNTDNYRKNPVIQWAHDYRTPPIAKSLKEWVEDGKLKSTALFIPKDISPFADAIGKMYANGFLNAVSVGFKSSEARWAADEDTRPWGIDFIKQELLEYSCVPVPANPEALIDAKSKGIDMLPILNWAAECIEAESDLPKEIAEKIYKTLSTKKNFTIPCKTASRGLFLLQKKIKTNENRRKHYEF